MANHYESALGIQVSGICFTGNESGLGDYFRGANPLQIAAHYGAVLARKDGDKIAYTNPVIEGETARTLAKFPDPWQHAKHMANFTLQGGDGAWSNFTPLHAAMGESHESSSLTLSREVLRNRGANHIAFSGHILDRIAEASESKKIEGPYASRTTEILLRYAGRMLDQQFATTQEKIVGEFAKKGITPHYEASAAIAATLDQHAATAAPTTPTKVNSDTASTALSREAALARQKEALALQGKTVAAMFNEAAKNLPKLEKQKMPWSATPEAKKEQPTAVKTPPPQPMPPQNAAAGNPPVRPAPAPQTLGAMVQTMLALNVALKNGAGGATSQALDAAGANTVMEAAQNLQTILESKKDLSGADLLKDAEVAKAVERFTQENRAFGEKANSAQDPKAQYLIRQMHSLFK